MFRGEVRAQGDTKTTRENIGDSYPVQGCCMYIIKGSQKAQKQHFRTPNYKTVRRKDTLGISLRVEGSDSRNGV